MAEQHWPAIPPVPAMQAPALTDLQMACPVQTGVCAAIADRDLRSLWGRLLPAADSSLQVVTEASLLEAAVVTLHLLLDHSDGDEACALLVHKLKPAERCTNSTHLFPTCSPYNRQLHPSWDGRA